MASMLDYNVRDMAQSAVQANKDHQYALKVYTERLEAELETVDKLLATADISEHEDELEVNAGGIVVVPGSIKPDGLVAPGDLLNEMSPLRDDAMRRQRYVESTVIHPMKQSELDALADGVRAENHRLHALEAQLRGQQPFVGMDNHPPSHFEINKLGIDWERVAMKVSSSGSSIVQRSAKECEIRWLGERHPQFNHTQWTQSEINRVRELLSGAKEGQVDWVDVAAKLGTRRTPIDCMRHAINRRVHIWTPEADERLLEAVRVYGVDSWTLVARLVSEDCTPTQCQSRYTRSLDPNIKRGSWTAEEDDQLRRAVAVFGHSWIEVATYVPGRNNEQCRDRYQDNLAPSVSRGKWTEDQDKALLQAIEKAGGLKWKEISRILDNGRTDNQCRARYSVLMKRRQKDDTNSPSPSSSGVPASGEQSTSGSRQSPSEPLPSNFANPNSLPDTGISTTGVEPPVARPKPKPRPRRKKAAEDASAGSTPTASGSAAAASTNTPHDAVATADTTNSVETVTEEGSSQAPRKTVRKPAKRRLSTQEGESVQLPKGKKTKTGKAPANVAHDSNSERNESEPLPTVDPAIEEDIPADAAEQSASVQGRTKAKKPISRRLQKPVRRSPKHMTRTPLVRSLRWRTRCHKRDVVARRRLPPLGQSQRENNRPELLPRTQLFRKSSQWTPWFRSPPSLHTRMLLMPQLILFLQWLRRSHLWRARKDSSCPTYPRYQLHQHNSPVHCTIQPEVCTRIKTWTADRSSTANVTITST